jgi:hypothetical protein
MLNISKQEDEEMGLFGKKNTSLWDFEEKLKREPQFMLDVLHLFDGNPTLATVAVGVKKLGFQLDTEGMLKAIARALEFYKRTYGDQFEETTGSGSNSFMGFSQN